MGLLLRMLVYRQCGFITAAAAASTLLPMPMLLLLQGFWLWVQTISLINFTHHLPQPLPAVVYPLLHAVEFTAATSRLKSSSS
jgi:hypothetical protein